MEHFLVAGIFITVINDIEFHFHNNQFGYNR
jgi:hypothetical protein